MNQRVDEIAVVGCGVVGLPFAVALASRGQCVVGIDVDAKRIASLYQGGGVGQEPELHDALAAALANGRLSFDTQLTARPARRAYVIAVPTPVDADGQPDLAALNAAVHAVGRVARDQELIMVRSTVPIGTSRTIGKHLASSTRTVRVASTPDRSLTGRSFADQFDVPHIVGGVCHAAAGEATQHLEALGRVIDAGSAETAEAMKLFANVQRDVSFALANELAMICDTLDLDFHRIRRLGSLDYERFSVARPGPVGGPCLTKDVHLLAASLRPGQPRPQLGLTGRGVNAGVVDHVARQIETFVDQQRIDTPLLAVLGLAFKGFPVTSEQRGSFGLSLIDRLRLRRPRLVVRAWDPEAKAEAATLDESVRGCNIVVLATEHRQLKDLDLDVVAHQMAPPGLVIDLWGGERTPPTFPDGIAYYAFGGGRRPGSGARRIQMNESSSSNS